MTEDRVPRSPFPIFVNPHAGMGGEGESELMREARALGLPVDLTVVEPKHLAERLREAVDEGVPMVGVAGGDGSLHTAANILCGSDTILAPFPGGTLNRFCRRLGLFSSNQALYWISRGAVDRVPLGVVDEELFLNSAVFGFYADVVRRRERLRPFLTKWVAAGVSTAAFLVKAPRMEVTVEVEGADEKQIRCSTPMVWVGLGGGSFPFVHDAPRPRGPNLLEVAIVRATTRRTMVGIGARLLREVLRRRRPIRLPQIEVYRASQIILSGSHRIGATLDGEPMRMEPPIFVGAQRDALRVVAPPDPLDGR